MGLRQNALLLLVACSAFAVGLWRGYSEPVATVADQHVGENGPTAFSQLAGQLATQQKLIETMLRSQQEGLIKSQIETERAERSKGLTRLGVPPASPSGGAGEGKGRAVEGTDAPLPVLASKDGASGGEGDGGGRGSEVGDTGSDSGSESDSTSPSGNAVGHGHSKGWEPAVVAHTLENTLKATSAARKRLFEMYDAREPVKETSANPSLFKVDATIRFTKGKSTPVFIDKQSRTGIVKRLLKKLTNQEPFVVSFGGHSSAAAHGNYYNQSYAHVFERTLKPAFDAARIPLVVRNHAMGGTGSVPGSYCMATVYGDDIDVASWDFGMTEGNNYDHTEMFFRAAIMQKKTPMVLLAHNNDNVRTDLVQHYSQAGFEAGGIRMNQALDMIPATHNLEQSKSLPYASQYLRCGDDMPWDECKSARYECTPCPEVVKQWAKEKPGVKAICPGQVSWHPGWRYHELKGSLLAVIFIDALSEAARKYQTFTMEMGPDLDPELYAMPERTLPKPKLCGKKSIAKSFCNHKFECATGYSPRVGRGISDLLVSEAALKKAGPTYAKYLPPKEGVKWNVELAPGEGDNAAHCTGHVDAKRNMLGKKGSGWMVLRVPKVERGLIMICEGPFSKRKVAEVEYMNTSSNVAMELDGKRIHYQRKITKSLCSVVTDSATPGDHLLAFEATGTKLTGFSYLIWA